MIDSNLIRLEEVCLKYFNVSPTVARRKGALGTLPVPAIRLSGTRKGPMYVRQTDLDKWVADRIANAEKLNTRMRMAGAV